MSLNKAIASGKEHRREYRYAKAVDRTCRNHGGRRGGASNQCPWCLDNRLYKNLKREEKADVEERRWRNGEHAIDTRFRGDKND